MNKALNFMRLDFITVRAYFTLKNLIIMIAAPLLIMVVEGGGTMAVGMFAIFAALYVNYPFIICEKNGMDALYPTLSIKRETVVLGRYLFALAFDFCAIIAGLVFSLIVTLIMKKTIVTTELLIISFVMLIVMSIIQAIQLPIYFKLGYEKAKLMAYSPFIALFLATVLLKPRLDGGVPEQIGSLLVWVEANPYLTALCGIVFWFSLMVISYQMSVSYYKKRDF